MRALGLLVLLSPAACSRSTTTDLPPASDLESWSEVVAALPSSPDDQARALNEYLQANGIPLSFWPAEGASFEDQPNVAVHEHPCGVAVSALFSRIPDEEDPAYIAEVVLEADDSGEILNTWNVPIDHVVVGLAGDEVLLDWPWNESALALAVATDGNLRIVSRPSTDPTIRDCPSDLGFGDSAYARCFDAPDQGTGRRRLIAYEVPCT